MTILSRADQTEELDAVIRQRKRIINALPVLDSIRVDSAVLHAADLNGLCYAYFPGKENRAPCALLAIALDTDRLPQDRWRWEAPTSPGSLGTVLFKALYDAATNLGRATQPVQSLMQEMRKFGAIRTPGTYTRLRAPKPTAEQARVADAVAQCLVHLVDTTPEDSAIRAIHHDLADAQPVVHLRPVRGYGAVYEPELRRAA